MNPNRRTQSDGPVRCSALLGAFVASQSAMDERLTPAQALAAAVNRIEAVSYTRGMQDALSRMEMVSAIVPETMTKLQMLALLKKEIEVCIARWERDVQAPNDKLSG